MKGEDFRGKSKEGEQQGCRKESHCVKLKVFMNHNFGPGAEQSAYENEKCSCVMCFSEEVPGGPEVKMESDQACGTMGKAV